MTVSILTGRIAGRLDDWWLVEGHQGWHSAYKHAIETEPQRSSDSSTPSARAVTRTYE